MAIYHASTDFNRVLGYLPVESTWALLNGFSTDLSMSPNLKGVAARAVPITDRDDLNPGTNIFVLAKTEAPAVVDKSYAVLRKKLDGGYVWLPDGMLRFQFEEEYPEDNDQLSWKIYDANNQVKQGAGSFPVVYGDNRFEINISPLISIGYGVLEVSNNKNEKWYLKFKTGGF